MFMMDSYEEDVKKFQAEAVAALQKELTERPPDPLRAEQRMFLVTLIEARLKKKVSQAELAARLGMQQPAIARIESGRGNPNLSTLLAIAKALDTDLMLEYKH